jgi:hypothetical protein
MDQPLREIGGLTSPPYYLVFIEFFGPKKSNVFKVLAFLVFSPKSAFAICECVSFSSYVQKVGATIRPIPYHI